jgi:carboxymethylenebutenolidase
MRELIFPALLLMTFAPAIARADEKADMRRMAQEHQHDKPTPSPAAMQEPAQPVTGAEVTYGKAGGKPLHGYVARPKSAQGALPSVIVIHEWWGLNDNIRAMTRRLAGEGYQALAVDLYGGAVASTPDEAMKIMNASLQNTAAGEENIRRAAAFLESKDAGKLGVIGW